MKINGYKLVMVEWEDSMQPISQWRWLEDCDEAEAVRCTSVGFVVSETKKALALAPNLGGTDTDKTQACGIIQIPRSAITKMKIL